LNLRKVTLDLVEQIKTEITGKRETSRKTNIIRRHQRQVVVEVNLLASGEKKMLEKRTSSN
jgi:hypothetical protein